MAGTGGMMRLHHGKSMMAATTATTHTTPLAACNGSLSSARAVKPKASAKGRATMSTTRGARTVVTMRKQG